MNRNLLHNSITENTNFTFARSGGAGGQNVNKVNTKVHAFIKINLLQGITEEERTLLALKLAANINKDNELFTDVQDERTQERNRAIALNRLEEKILNALKKKKKRIKTKPTASSIEKRLKSKKLRSLVKQSRNWKSE